MLCEVALCSEALTLVHPSLQGPGSFPPALHQKPAEVDAAEEAVRFTAQK